MDKGHVCKIADFGLARDIYEKKQYLKLGEVRGLVNLRQHIVIFYLPKSAKNFTLLHFNLKNSGKKSRPKYQNHILLFDYD